MNKIFAHIEGHVEENVARLRRACAQPSVSALGQGLTEMADLVAGMLRQAGFEVELAPTPGAPVVVGRMDGRGDRTVLFYNHYDVQPVDPLDEWTSPPFEPTERDGKLYARGAADNKGPIVARLGAVESFLDHRDELPVNLVWVIEGEEETGSPHLGAFAEQYAGLLREAYGCVWEAGGKNARDRYVVSLGCKGLLYVQLRARGAIRDLHSALAATVPSPAWRLLWALNSLKGPDGSVLIPGFYDDVLPITDAQRKALTEWDYPEEEDRALYGIDRFRDGLTGQALKVQLIFGSTCNVDGFHTGYGGPGSKTVLPSEASAKLDFRLVPDQDPDRILAQMRDYLDDQGFEDVEIVSADGERPAAGDPDHPFVQTAARTAESVYGQAPFIVPMMSGTGPVHVLCDQFDVPMVTAGVGYANSRAHAPDENVRISDFIAHQKYIANLLDALGE